MTTAGSPPPGSLAFLGTPEIAVPALAALCDAGLAVDVVVTAPDARRSRRGAPTPTPVRREAERRGIEVVFDHDELAGRGIDRGIVVAYGRIIPAPLLEEIPMVNLHFSLLPRWRGAAPVEHAILAGDEQTGVCVMEVEAGLDSGPVHSRVATAVGDKTRDELWNELAATGADLLVETLRRGLGPGEPQRGEVTVAPKLAAEDRRLDWEAPAVVASRVVRLSGAWTTLDGRRLGVVSARPATEPRPGRPPGELAPDGPRVACGRGSLELVTVRPEGRAEMDAVSWWNGLRDRVGVRLGT